MIKADLNLSLRGKLHLLHGRTTGLIANINFRFVSQEATKNFYHNLINMNQGIVNSESEESWVLPSSTYTHHQQFGCGISVLRFGMINHIPPIAHFCTEWETLEHCKYESFYWQEAFIQFSTFSLIVLCFREKQLPYFTAKNMQRILKPLMKSEYLPRIFLSGTVAYRSSH